jgi:hypothetical protein
MSYAIGYIIYGIPYDPLIHGRKLQKLHESDQDFRMEWDLDDIDSMGFTTVYSANGFHPVGWIGKCYDTFTEGVTFDFSSKFDYVMSKSEEFEADFQECLSKVPDFIKEIVEDEKPKVWVVWGSS